jgi:general stress protein YciG
MYVEGGGGQGKGEGESGAADADREAAADAAERGGPQEGGDTGRINQSENLVGDAPRGAS